MLQKLETMEALCAVSFSSSLESRLRHLVQAAHKEGANAIRIRFEERGQIKKAAMDAGAVARQHSLGGVVGMSEDVANAVDFLGPIQAGEWVEPDRVNHLATNLAAMVSALIHSLKERHIFVLSTGAAEMITNNEPFGGDVIDAFPSATFDIKEAARCLSFERWTAAVLHCMRALEPALIAFASGMGVSSEKKEWWPLIRNIENEIKRRKELDGHDALQLESEAASHFSAIKDAWRNYAVHGKDNYDEERARSAYAATGALMRQLSSCYPESSPV